MSIRQKEVYDFIDRFARENGYAPSIGDISSGTGCGVSTVVAHLNALKGKGYVSSEAGKTRTLRVVREP